MKKSYGIGLLAFALNSPKEWGYYSADCRKEVAEILGVDIEEVAAHDIEEALHRPNGRRDTYVYPYVRGPLALICPSKL